MVDKIENKVLIREFNEERDIEVVGKLEKNCEIGSNKGVSFFTNMMGDPLCRIRFYAVHVMLVGENYIHDLSYSLWASPYIYIYTCILTYRLTFSFLFSL